MKIKQRRGGTAPSQSGRQCWDLLRNKEAKGGSFIRGEDSESTRGSAYAGTRKKARTAKKEVTAQMNVIKSGGGALKQRRPPSER